MTLVRPGVAWTAVVTAPFESSVRAWPVASSAPPRTIFLNVARVPDDGRAEDEDDRLVGAADVLPVGDLAGPDVGRLLRSSGW